MHMTKKIFLSCVILLGLAALLLGVPANLLSSGGQAPYHIVVLGDPHLPGKFLAEKEAVLRTINSWSDVALVVALGDICEDLGTEQEYAAARQFFDKLVKTICTDPGESRFYLCRYKNARRQKHQRVGSLKNKINWQYFRRPSGFRHYITVNWSGIIN